MKALGFGEAIFGVDSVIDWSKSKPRDRFGSRIEAPKLSLCHLLHDQVPSREVDKSEGRFWSHWNKERTLSKTFVVQYLKAIF